MRYEGPGPLLCFIEVALLVAVVTGLACGRSFMCVTVNLIKNVRALQISAVKMNKQMFRCVLHRLVVCSFQI